MKPFNFICLVTASILLAMPVTSVAAQDVGEVLQEIGYQVEKKKTIETQLDSNIELKRRIEEEFDTLAAEESQIDAESEQIDAETYQLEADVAYYNSYCTGTFEEPEYTIRMNWCNANQGPLDSRSYQLEQQINNFNSRINDYNYRYDSLVDQDNARVAEAENLYQEYESVNMRLSALEEILRLSQFAAENDECVEKESLESMHHCMQTIWDGAQ